MDRRRRPPRYNAVVASAAVMLRRPEGLARRAVKTEAWQEDAWRFYDEVGELRFAIGWISNGLSRINLLAARRPRQLGDEPEPLRRVADDDTEARPLTPVEQDAIDLVEAIGGGPDGQAELLSRLGTLLSVPGIGWVLIEDPGDLAARSAGVEVVRPDNDADDRAPAEPTSAWQWRVLSNDEVRTASGQWEVVAEDDEQPWRPVAQSHVLVKVWRAHPRHSGQPDSPCRAARTVLNEITLLDEHISATAQSRLAGAGILVIPSEVEFKPVRTHAEAGAGDGEPVDDDDFADVLVDTMTVPIGDRSSAAAVVPLVAKVPGEYVDKVRHISFWTEFSDAVPEIQERAVKRLALALDMPPEIVTGVSGMNHWGAWQVQEEAVTLHIEPLAEIVTKAFTIGYLRAGLSALGHAGAEGDELMVWYSTADLTTRPDRSDDAIAAYDRIELSGSALRREAGLSESDAPSDAERHRRLLVRALDRAPSLSPGLLEALGVHVDLDMIDPTIAPRSAVETVPEPDLPPITGPDTEPPVAAASTRAVIEASDGLVHRALEVAGARLRAAAGRGVRGGSAAVACDDPAVLHTQLDACTFAELGDLLRDAWTRAPAVAARLGIDPETYVAQLDAYARSLLAAGHAHDLDRLADHLGLVATV